MALERLLGDTLSRWSRWDSLRQKAVNTFYRLTPKSANALGLQRNVAPSAQVAVDIFKGDWASILPEPFSHLRAGKMKLTEHPGIRWGLAEVGSLAGKTVLELGPLEASHTYLLAQAGAQSITAIESNTRAFLKCLVVKELLELTPAHFLCGDCLTYLRESRAKFDFALASGILYHMENPVELIELLSRASDRLLLWTHYFDPKIMQGPTFRHFDAEGVSHQHAGFPHRLHRQNYGKALSTRTFWGGTALQSAWLSRSDILGALAHFGYTKVTVGPEETNSPGGPSFTLLATR